MYHCGNDSFATAQRVIADKYKLVYSLFQKVVHRWHVPIHVHAGSPNVHRGWGLPLPTDGLLLMLGNVTPLGVLLPGTVRGRGEPSQFSEHTK